MAVTNDSLVFRPGPPPFTGNAPTLPDGTPVGGGTTQIFLDKDPTAPPTPTLVNISIPSNGGAWTAWIPAQSAWI